MKFYDLFCGIGGFRFALEQFGHECVGSCEIDDNARKIYSKNFGQLPSDRDARLINTDKLPEFDILTAGFPCQAFSIAGKRLGFDDERGNLFFEITRIAKQKRPKTLFLENVKGLLNHDSGRTFATIINTLYEMGYDVEWQVINGKYFLPQNRERVFIIGHSRDKPFRKVFPITDSHIWNIKPQEKTQREGERIRSQISGTIDANYWKGGRTVLVCPILVSQSDGNSNPKLHINKRYRNFTPLECERLMGFPDNWTEGLSDTKRYRLIGNSVMIPVIKEIVRYL